LSTGVHQGVLLHKLPPAQRFISVGMESEVGEVVGGEPKTLLVLVLVCLSTCLACHARA
jgi:hypothetical protein